MNFISTRDTNISVNFHDALFQGLAMDGGLYIPTHMASLPESTLQTLYHDKLPQLSLTLMQYFLKDIPTEDLNSIINKALNFPIPLKHLNQRFYLLEVFHGPTLAFKDVGARFMANVMTYFLKKENQKVIILVATSGDTGSAIANAFHGMDNVDVFVLYPSQKISFLQEQQITTLGDNIHALEVLGTFDDCQQLVKSALLDNSLRKNRLVTTANSINIARLLPQLIYHTWGVCQLKQLGVLDSPILSIPSGNFGNLTSAVYAQSLGIDIQHIIAATNINDIVPHYLETNQFLPKPSLHSLSNAMDVGNPSNFERLIHVYNNDIHQIRPAITGISITDQQTLHEIRHTYEQTGIILDPHTAVGMAAARHTEYKPIIVTATAHPAKFPEVIKLALGIEAEVPKRLARCLHKQKYAIKITPQYNELVLHLRNLSAG